MNTEINIAKYPALTQNSAIQEQAQLVHETGKLKDQQTSTLEELIGDVQGECDHQFEKEMEHDESYIWNVHGNGRGEGIMKGKRCIKCGLYEPRPAGLPWVVCHKCGGDMEHIETIPGRGEKQYIHECIECSHTVSHT